MFEPSALFVASVFLIGGASFHPKTAAANPGRDEGRAEQVRFRHGCDLLSGTLYLPNKPGRSPAVALVLGSGGEDRMYSGVGLALGRHFADHGFACLVWDKPGVGKSTGDYRAQTFRDRAEEVLAAVHYLQAREDIQSDRVGIWGHSQGGMVAPLAASLSPDIAFLIEASGWQGPAWQQDQVRVEAELRADGFPDAAIAKATAFAKKRMELIRGTESFEALDRMQEAVKTLDWFEYVHRCDRALFYSARKNVAYDTAPSWENVHCPVLVLFGDRDTLSGPPKPLVDIIRRGLKKAGNDDVSVKIFPNADHSLCKTLTGGRKEARERSKSRKKESGPDFVDGYLETMVSWLQKRNR